MLLFKRNLIRTMSVFSQTLNPLVGKSIWEVQDEEYDYHQEIARSAFADMLHDSERNQKYYQGIKAAIEKMHSMNKKANVLDIGTGTGLLSMMAVTCGADSVTAIEGFKPVADCARKIIKENGFEDKIHLISDHSSNIHELKIRPNILVTEIFDTELIGEGALKTFHHAHKELMEGCSDIIVVPDSAVVYAQVVESPLFNDLRKIKPIVDSDDGLPIVNIPNSIQECFGITDVHDIQLSQFPVTHFRTVIPPTPVFLFDWCGKSEEISFDRKAIYEFKSEHNGEAHVVFMWWDLKMDTDGELVLSCAPFWAHPDAKKLKKKLNLPVKDTIPWRDHWMQGVYFLPNGIKVKKGDYLKLISCHDDYSFWFNLKVNKEIVKEDYDKPKCECGLHFSLSRTRIGQLNNSSRNKKYLSVLKNKVNAETICLSLSDASLLGSVAAQMGAKKVYCLENGIHATNGLKKIVAHNNLSDKVQYYNEIDDILDLPLEEINLIMAEPNFIYSLVPWDNLHFLYLLKNKLKDKLAKDIEITPVKAIIRGIAVNFLNLNKIKSSLETLEGFKMTYFDEMIKDSSNRADDKVEPQPLWEYPCYPLSLPVDMIDFDIKNFNNKIEETLGQIKFTKSGKFNGIALWVDWFLDESLKNIVTTGPVDPPRIGEEIKWDMYTKQGVFLLGDSIEVKEDDVIYYTVNCSECVDKITFNFELNNEKL